MEIKSGMRSLDTTISAASYHRQDDTSLILSRLQASRAEGIQLEAEKSSVPENKAENEATAIKKTDKAAKNANDVAPKDKTKEEADNSAIVKRGSVVYVPFFGPCNQLVNTETAVWLASLVPGLRLKVLSGREAPFLSTKRNKFHGA
jgi:hypothetical protein